MFVEFTHLVKELARWEGNNAEAEEKPESFQILKARVTSALSHELDVDFIS